MKKRKFSGIFCIECDTLVLKTNDELFCSCHEQAKKDDKKKLIPIPHDKWKAVQISVATVHGGKIAHGLPLPMKKYVSKHVEV